MAQTLAINGGRPIRTAAFPAWPIFGEEEEAALLRALRSGKWGRQDGKEVATFERRFAEYHNVPYAVAVVNGTVSLRIALLAAGIKAGDEVIVPPYTFLATASCVVEANATPVFVDLEPDTYNIDPEAIERAITPRTRAIIPVHLAGLPADMDAIMEIARRNNLVVIEDAAHAHGAEYKGRRAGSLGHMASFSFQSSKNLCSGEGGIILTNDEEFHARCRSVHNCGRIPGGAWYEHHVICGNYRPSEFQGALLNAQLDRFDEQARHREEMGLYLRRRLAKVPGIRPQNRDRYPVRHGYHLFVFRYDASVFGVPRSVFIKALAAEGIPAAEGYVIPLHRQRLFLDKAFGPYTACFDTRPELDFSKITLPVCERASGGEGAWLYQSLLLGSKSDMDDIANAFEKIHEHRAELASVAQ
ncbi:MAG TPA: DegT/DnrJ/EryC1/StrS family aminotransferase [Phycisphaerae bacterium]|nr:DegT/DnrJ/EryC1/StrS family aminotransferase [Phycisphaerae bacterium]